ncbi:MAG: enoyl-CoA hydratase/isomerase family protein [Pseudonocardiaceae bacterium]
MVLTTSQASRDGTAAIRVGWAAEGVAELVIDRAPVNALDRQAQRELRMAAHALAGDEHARTIVVRGEGHTFSAGADIKEMAVMSSEEMVEHATWMQRSFMALLDVPVPTIAAIDGAALGGGCELAMCADLRIAGASSRIGLTEARIGVIPAAGGTQMLPRLVGLGPARRMIFTGEPISAGEAFTAGLVDEVVPDGEAAVAAVALASTFARRPRSVLVAAKRGLTCALRDPLARGLLEETAAFLQAFTAPARQQAMAAFLAGERGESPAADRSVG